MDLGSLWVIGSLAFVVALSGALVPGPVLTYTIVKTIETRKRAYLTGVWVIAGHAILEMVIVALLLAGFSVVLRNPVVIKIIATGGGAFLVYLGVSLIVDVARGRVPDLFAGAEATAAAEEVPGPSALKIRNPVLGGFLVSMSNPYWWVWWASIGFAFIYQYDVSFRNWPRLIAFFVGHQAGDLTPYWLVSILVSLGKRRINTRVYHVILAVCGAVMVVFGGYLAVSTYLRG